jgi:hypothetical protein
MALSFTPRLGFTDHGNFIESLEAKQFFTQTLDVDGPTVVDGTLSVTGITTLIGNATLTGNLNVTGVTTLTGNTGVTGDFTASGSITGKQIITEALGSGIQTLATGLLSTLSWGSATNASDVMWVISDPTNFTIITPGIYHVECTVAFNANATGERRLLIQHDRGGSNTTIGDILLSAAPTSTQRVHVCGRKTCLAGDKFRALAFQSSGGNLSINASAGLVRMTVCRTG